jgi:hypothetical protein
MGSQDAAAPAQDEALGLAQSLSRTAARGGAGAMIFSARRAAKKASARSASPDAISDACSS